MRVRARLAGAALLVLAAVVPGTRAEELPSIATGGAPSMELLEYLGEFMLKDKAGMDPMELEAMTDTAMGSGRKTVAGSKNHDGVGTE